MSRARAPGMVRRRKGRLGSKTCGFSYYGRKPRREVVREKVRGTLSVVRTDQLERREVSYNKDIQEG